MDTYTPIGTTMPEAENTVIGLMLIGYEHLPEFLDALQPDDFTVEINRDIFRAVSQIFTQASAETVDSVTVASWMRATSGYTAQEIESQIKKCSIETPSVWAYNIPEYIAAIKTAAQRRKSISALSEALSAVTTGTETPEQLQRAQVALEAMENTGVASPGDALTAIRAERAKALAAARKALISGNANLFADIGGMQARYRERAFCIPTGFSFLDRALSGGVAPGITAIAGGTSTGKTAFCLSLCASIIRNNKKVDVLYFGTENTLEEVESRTIARMIAEYNTDQEREGEDGRLSNVTRAEVEEYFCNWEGSGLDPGKRQAIEWATGKYPNMYGNRLQFVPANFSLKGEDCVNLTAEYMSTHPGRRVIIAVDYLQNLRPSLDQWGRPMDVRQSIDEAVANIESFCKMRHIPAFVLSSIPRSKYHSGFQIDALKESGGIEFSADTILGLQLEEIHTPEYMAIPSNRSDWQEEFLEYAADVSNPLQGGRPSDGYRHMELVCRKNRKGAKSWTLYWEYDPAHEHFRERIERMSYVGEINTGATWKRINPDIAAKVSTGKSGKGAKKVEPVGDTSINSPANIARRDAAKNAASGGGIPTAPNVDFNSLFNSIGTH